MKILITGGAGFIGSNLSLTLQKDNSITVVDNLLSGNTKNLESFQGNLITDDITSMNLLKSFKDIDVIFHQAAITDTTVSDEKRMMEVNVGGFRRILDLALRKRVTLVYASSAGVYGNGKCPMREDQELSPQNVYARSKLLMDEIAIKYKDKIRIIGLRYFNVYGPREGYKKKAASMIYQLAQQMKASKNPRIFKYGEQSRDFIYVKDVVDATIRAMKAKESGVVNVGTGVVTTFNRVIEILNEVLGTSYEPEYFDNPYSFYQDETRADINRAEELLGFKARYSIEEGIRDYLTTMQNAK
ncbi:ADP-glyceromanno-heptose 6-epimerase [bacterium]|nr:ADP-glyceromanno-heptose 6-epimerase [bacterium]MCG2677737.1 ADP-glyceromanno-heptose 6-epimerase [bacterium]